MIVPRAYLPAPWLARERFSMIAWAVMTTDIIAAIFLAGTPYVALYVVLRHQRRAASARLFDAPLFLRSQPLKMRKREWGVREIPLNSTCFGRLRKEVSGTFLAQSYIAASKKLGLPLCLQILPLETC